MLHYIMMSTCNFLEKEKERIIIHLRFRRISFYAFSFQCDSNDLYLANLFECSKFSYFQKHFAGNKYNLNILRRLKMHPNTFLKISIRQILFFQFLSCFCLFCLIRKFSENHCYYHTSTA